MKPHVAKQPEITLISPEGKVVRRSEFFECPEVIVIGDKGVARVSPPTVPVKTGTTGR
ncbi:MAG: hypothetical protein WCQ16_07425 [Verrucomicrobiae bacterium]